MSIAFPGESAEYRVARDRLLEQEVELRRITEAVSAARRDSEAIRHFWGSELLYVPPEPEQDPRHNDSIDSQWNLFDFTPEGRGTDWYPELSYS